MSNDNDEFQKILKSVIDENGAGILTDASRMNAFLLDLAYEHGKYRKLITIVLQEDIGDILLSAMDSDSEAEEQALKKCLQRLKSETWLKESAMVLAINMLAYSVGLGCQLPEYKEPEPVPETAAAPVTMSAVAPSAQFAAAPSTVNNVPLPSVKRTAEIVINKGDVPVDCREIGRYLTGVTKIGYKAFAGNDSIRSVVIPDNVKCISAKAFSGCTNLVEIHIPKTIEEIGDCVFEKCAMLTAVYLDNSPKYSVINDVLVDKEKKRVIRAFGNQTRLTLPNGIKRIGTRAFDNSSVSKLCIPSTVERIERNAFADCRSLNAFDVDSGNFWFSSYEGVLYSNEGMKLVQYPQGRRQQEYFIDYGTVEICENAFRDAFYLESVTFVSSLRKIGERAFQDCHRLLSAALSAGITIIGERAFQDCESLTNITLPISIKEIGDFAFCGCRSITAILIPPMVDRIGNCTFMGCRNLERVIIQEGVCFIGDRAFSGCSGNITIYVRNNNFVKQYCQSYGIACIEI